jgi:hypothetical protein
MHCGYQYVILIKFSTEPSSNRELYDKSGMVMLHDIYSVKIRRSYSTRQISNLILIIITVTFCNSRLMSLLYW